MTAAATWPDDVPTLTDGTVTLRAHELADVARIVEQCTDPQSIEWTTVPVSYGEADAVAFVQLFVPELWRDRVDLNFAVDVDGRFGGTVSLRPRGSQRAEIAFGAHPDVRGTGAMERALRLLLAWGLDQCGLQVVTWLANVGNVASRDLAERVGFRFEGTLTGFLDHRGVATDAWVGSLRRDWPRQRPQRASASDVQTRAGEQDQQPGE